MNTEEQEMKVWFKKYLNEIFGDGFDRFAEPPEGIRYGERLMYKYKNDVVSARQEATQQDVDEFNASIEKMVKKVGASAYVPAELPVTSGLSLPRYVDLREMHKVTGEGMKKYLDSDEVLPSEDFELEWLLGVEFSSYKTLHFLDFTHQKVKGVFTFHYALEDVFEAPGSASHRFVEFLHLLTFYRHMSDTFDGFAWVKIAQLDSKITIAVNDAL